MTRHVLLLLSVACATLPLAACNQPTEFFPLPQFATEGGCTDPGRPNVAGFRREPIIVAHPPSDREALKRALEAYDRRTLPENVLSAMCHYKRKFYRETKYTPRKYVEGNHGFLEHDRFEDHENDIIAIVQWNGGHDTAAYEFYEDGSLVK